IYTAARLLMPALIVECGVYKGQTTWFLRRAAPRAEIVAFDLDLEQRAWRDDAVRYHAADWTEVPVHAVQPARSLAFFDDHVSHARRIREAYARGFRTLLLGDDLAAEALH